MKYSVPQYLEAFDSYFSPDEEVTHTNFKMVMTRKEHECSNIDEPHTIPSKSLVIRETGIHQDLGRVVSYVCLDCLNPWADDIFSTND